VVFRIARIASSELPSIKQCLPRYTIPPTT
jgi:hypothetical protein